MMRGEVPIWEKPILTLEEAAAYFGISEKKIKEITDRKDCRFVLWNGNKRLIKRKLMDNYLETEFSI